MSPRWISLLCVPLLFASGVSAQPAKDPLRFAPSQAEFVVKIDRPRELIEAVETNELFQDAKKLAGVRDLYDTTTYQQLYQLIKHYEKELGQSRDEIIDDISAGGMVIAARLTPPKGALLILQAKDEKKLRRFINLTLEIAEKELERQESKDKIVRTKYEGIEIGQIGPGIHFAIVDGALLVSPLDTVLKKALDIHLRKEQSIFKNARFVEGRAQVADKALAWTWLDLEELRKDQGFKSGLDAAGLDPAQMLLFGGLADLLKRSPNLTASLLRDGPRGYRIVVQMPRGTEGMAQVRHLIVPSEGGGTLPPLLPPRVVSSSSYYLDLGQLWQRRVEILGEKNAKGLEDGNKGIAQFLGGIKISKLLQSAGPHHRLVFAQQKESPYQIKPAAPFPAFALVLDMRDPSFGKDMSQIFRTAALVATFQVGLTLKEDKYKDCDMVSYYFSETKKVDGDPTNARFNFSPTYVTVGDQFVVSGTAELARDLIDLLQTEKKAKSSKASMRTQVFASGFADIARSNQDVALTQLILAQALPPKTAKEELHAILDWVNRLGVLELQSNYGANDFRYDILWQPKKK